MIEDTKTHRCSSCAQEIEHYQADLCPSCGKCEKHCAADNHKPMETVSHA